MSRQQIGSFEWAQLAGGNLRRNERLRMMAQEMLLHLSSIAPRILRNKGMRRATVARIDLNSIRIPDTRDARDAFELCVENSPVFLVNHCLRTYLWGALLAAGEQLHYDEELFYVASLLHDLGLTNTYQCRGNCCCFAAQGALTAQQFAHDHHWPETRQHALSSAICLHLNVDVSQTQGIEAHLLHVGANLDVTGARYNRIHPLTRNDVLERHPRTGFKTKMSSLMQEEATIFPTSRTGFLVALGLNNMIRNAPFSE